MKNGQNNMNNLDFTRNIGIMAHLECLEKESIDECNHHNCKDYGIEPVQQSISFLSFLIFLLPEKPLHLAGDMMVEDRDKSEEPPIVSEPDYPQDVKDSPKAEPRPFIVV